MTVKEWIFGLAFMSGMALAGAEGEWFPYINMAGVCLLAGCAVLANHMEAK